MNGFWGQITGRPHCLVPQHNLAAANMKCSACRPYAPVVVLNDVGYWHPTGVSEGESHVRAAIGRDLFCDSRMVVFDLEAKEVTNCFRFIS